MSEACPLKSGKYYWDSDIPEVCRENCEQVWDKVTASQVPRTDEITSECGDQPECTHDVEFGAEILERIDAKRRGYIILHSCAIYGTDIDNEHYSFKCPNS